MTIYDLKQSFQGLLRPACKYLAARGVTANQVTLAALALSCITAALVFFSEGAVWALLLVPLVMFLRMALNAIDGMLAREHDMKSVLGAVLNELGDVLSDTMLYLAFAAVAGISALPLVLVVVFAVISEMTGVIAVQIGVERRYDGPMGKSDRAFVFGALALLIGLGFSAGSWSTGLLWLVLVLLVVTIINRARRAIAAAVALG